MDLSNAPFYVIAAIALWFGPRLILDSVGKTGDSLSVLFVPPDWKLGWPHGVQEGDADWGWRTPVAAGAQEVVPSADDAGSPELVELIDGSPLGPGDGLVVETRRVHRT